MADMRLLPLLDRFASSARRQGARFLPDQACRSDVIPRGDILGRLGHTLHALGLAESVTSRSLVSVDAYTTGCGGQTLVDLPVSGVGSDFKTAKPARVCAVDDMAYEFPKYAG